MKKYLTVFAGVFLATTGLSASNSFMDQLHLIESLSPKDTLISQQQLDTLHEELKDTKAKLAREKVKLKFAKSVLEATNPATLLNTLGGNQAIEDDALGERVTTLIQAQNPGLLNQTMQTLKQGSVLAKAVYLFVLERARLGRVFTQQLQLPIVMGQFKNRNFTLAALVDGGKAANNKRIGKAVKKFY